MKQDIRTVINENHRTPVWSDVTIGISVNK
jgi:hypothetical protein